jgi:hypothetical protein
MEKAENIKNEIPHLAVYKWGISNFNLKQIFVEQKNAAIKYFEN